MLAGEIAGVLELDVGPPPVFSAGFETCSPEQRVERYARPSGEVRDSVSLDHRRRPEAASTALAEAESSEVWYASARIASSLASRSSAVRSSSSLQETQSFRQREEPPQRVVLPQQQAGTPTREVNSRYGSSTPRRHQIVHQHADEGLVPAQNDRLAAERAARPH